MADKFKEVNNLIETVYKRLNSAFISSYVISYIVFNWKFFIVLLSGKDYEVKFNYIRNVIYPCSFEIYLAVIAPFLFAIFYTLYWPTLDSWIVRYVQNKSNEDTKKLLLIQQKTPFDEVEQGNFFARWNDEIQHISARYHHFRNKYHEVNTQLEILKNEYKHKNEAATTRMLMTLTGLDYNAASSLFDDPMDIDQELIDKVVNMPEWKSLVTVGKKVNDFDRDGNGLGFKIENGAIEAISINYEGSDQSALIDILYGLGILQSYYEANYPHYLLPQGQTKLDNIVKINKMKFPDESNLIVSNVTKA